MAAEEKISEEFPGYGILYCPEDYKMCGKKNQMTETLTVDEYRKLKAKPHIPKKKHSNKGDKAKWEMEIMLKLTGLNFKKEFVFHPTRRWRADFAIESLNCLIEYEGIFSEKSRHTTISGFIEDCLKYREAAKLGWKVLRYTNKDYTKLSEDINQILNQKQ